MADRCLVLRNAVGIRAVIAAHPVPLRRVGKALEEEYSHRNCWLRLVAEVNRNRSPQETSDSESGLPILRTRKDYRGRDIQPFTPEQVEAEWSCWEAHKAKLRPIQNHGKCYDLAHAIAMDRAARSRMPSAKQRTLVDLRQRAYEWMVKELFGTIKAHRSLLPEEDDCLRLILIWWALTDEHSRTHPIYLTAFQYWRQQRQGVLFAESPDLYYPLNTSQRADACNDPKGDVDPARGILASRKLDEEHALLEFALDVLRDSDAYGACLTEDGSGRRKHYGGPQRSTKKPKGKRGPKPKHNLPDEEALQVAKEWQAAYKESNKLTKATWLKRREERGDGKMTLKQLGSCLRLLRSSKG